MTELAAQEGAFLSSSVALMEAELKGEDVSAVRDPDAFAEAKAAYDAGELSPKAAELFELIAEATGNPEVR